MSEEKDWTKCTNEERLAECRRRFPKGTKINSVFKSQGTSLGVFELYDDNNIFVSAESCFDICVYEHETGKFAEIVTEKKPIETKEQIRTELINELINELIEKFDGEMYLKKHSTNEVMINAHNLALENCIKISRSLLPPETPEKIAERKAVEILKSNGWTIECVAYPDVQSMLIEALLTDIKTK